MCCCGNWQIGLAASFLELTPGWERLRSTCVGGKGGAAWKEAGRDNREEVQDRRASTGHQATFCRHLDPVMFIAHLLQAHTVLRVFARVVLGKPHSGPGWSVSHFTDKTQTRSGQVTKVTHTVQGPEASEANMCVSFPETCKRIYPHHISALTDSRGTDTLCSAPSRFFSWVGWKEKKHPLSYSS